MPLRTTTFSSITPRQIRVIGVPLDLGQNRRGVDMGPSAVRVAGLEARLEAIGHNVEDAGNITVANAITWSSAYWLTLSAANGIILDAIDCDNGSQVSNGWLR